jgi:hypothetical protein
MLNRFKLNNKNAISVLKNKDVIDGILEYAYGKEAASLEPYAKYYLAEGSETFGVDKNKKIFRAHSLRKWAFDKKLNYKDLNACARNKIKSSQGFKVFYRETWIKMGKEEKIKAILSFSNYDSNLESAISRRKTFWVLSNNKIQKVTNLKEFANKNNLNVECLYLTKRNKQKKHKGFKVFSTEQEAIVHERLQEEILVANSFNSGKLQTDSAVDNPELSLDIIDSIEPDGPNGYLRGTIATIRYLEKYND